MKINRYVIEKYIHMLTQGAAASDEDPMEDVTNYDADIELMLAAAREAGDEDVLKMSLDALLANPGGRIRSFNGQVYAFDQDDMVELLGHAYAQAWPGEARSMPGEEIDLEFDYMSDEEWAIRQGKG